LKCTEEYDVLSAKTFLWIVKKLILDELISGGTSLSFLKGTDVYKDRRTTATWRNETKTSIIFPNGYFARMHTWFPRDGPDSKVFGGKAFILWSDGM
jgi:hypothetical protein